MSQLKTRIVTWISFSFAFSLTPFLFAYLAGELGSNIASIREMLHHGDALLIAVALIADSLGKYVMAKRKTAPDILLMALFIGVAFTASFEFGIGSQLGPQLHEEAFLWHNGCILVSSFVFGLAAIIRTGA